MATIPESIDYGARPSLRSNRIDLPGRGELAVADALSNAANTFAAVMLERKHKQDRFNYNMAKQELLTADLTQREALKDRTDWQEFDEAYRTGLASSRERITRDYQLTPHDAAIFSAEADYIRERGASAVGSMVRKYEIDEKVTGLSEALARARENIINADPSTRNDQLLTVMDLINAGVGEGWLDESDGLKLRQDFTQDVAVASLTSMDPEDAIDIIKQSLANRAAGGPLTAEDIREGRGTDSIADFLHTDVANEMLDKLERENKTTQDRTAAFAAVDEAFELYPGKGNAGKRMKHIRQLTKGDADVRDIAQRSGRIRNEEERSVEMDTVNGIIAGIDEAIAENPNFNLDMVPANDWERLTVAQKNMMERRYSNVRNGSQFADSTNWHSAKFDEDDNLVLASYDLWGDMSPEEKAITELSLPAWTNAFELGVWKQLEDEQNRIRQGTVTQVAGPTDDQLFRSVVVGRDLIPLTGKDAEENTRYQKFLFMFKDYIEEERVRKYGGGRVPYLRRREILMEMLGQMGWERGLFLDAGEGAALIGLEPSEYADQFVPIATVRQQPTSVEIKGVVHRMNYEEWLTNKADTELDGHIPSEKQIENAYFAVIADMGDKEILARLMGKGDD